MPYGENSQQQQQLTHRVSASRLENYKSQVHNRDKPISLKPFESHNLVPLIFTHGLDIHKKYDYEYGSHFEWIKINRKKIQPEESGMEKLFHITYPLGTHDLFTSYYEEVYKLSYQLEHLKEELETLAHFDLDKSQAICEAFDTLKDEIPEKISKILKSNLTVYKKLMAGQYPILHPILARKSVEIHDKNGNTKNVYVRNTNLKNLFNIDSYDFIQTDGKNYYSILPAPEALTKLENFIASYFDESWNELLKLEDYNESLNTDFHLGMFGYEKNRYGENCLPTGARKPEDVYYGQEATFGLNFSTTLLNFDNKFASNVRKSVEDEIKSFNEYRERAETLYPKYTKLRSTIVDRLEEINSEDYFLSVVESVNAAIVIEEEKERLRLLEVKRLKEEAAEKARVEKAEKHEVWLTEFEIKKQAVRDTGKCGCTDRKGDPKDNYPTKADAYKVAAKQMEKTDDLDLNVYECDEGEHDSYNRFHEYGGWHLTRIN